MKTTEHKKREKGDGEVQSDELIYYRLEQIENTHAKQHHELVECLEEIKENQHGTNEVLVEHDYRLKQLEAKNETQEKYVYGIVILVLTQVLAEVLEILLG